MKKLSRKIKLNFSQYASKSGFGRKNGFKPLLNFLSFLERIAYNHANTNLEKIARQINIS